MSLGHLPSVFSDQPSDLSSIIQRNDSGSEQIRLNLFYDSIQSRNMFPRERPGRHGNSEAPIDFNRWVGISDPPVLSDPSSNLIHPFECASSTNTPVHIPSYVYAPHQDFSFSTSVASGLPYGDSFFETAYESSQSASTTALDVYPHEASLSGSVFFQSFSQYAPTVYPVLDAAVTLTTTATATAAAASSEPNERANMSSQQEFSAAHGSTLQPAPGLGTWSRQPHHKLEDESSTTLMHTSQRASRTSSSGTRKQKMIELTNAETGMQVVVVRQAIKPRSRKHKKGAEQRETDSSEAPKKVIQSSSDTTQIFLPAITVSTIHSRTNSKSDPRTMIGIAYESDHRQFETDFEAGTGAKRKDSNKASANIALLSDSLSKLDTSSVSGQSDNQVQNNSRKSKRSGTRASSTALANSSSSNDTANCDTIKPPIFYKPLDDDALVDPRELKVDALFTKDDVVPETDGDPMYSATDPAYLLGSPQHMSEVISDFSSTEVTHNTLLSDRHLKWRRSASKDVSLLQEVHRTQAYASNRTYYTYYGVPIKGGLSGTSLAAFDLFDFLRLYDSAGLSSQLSGRQNKSHLASIASTVCVRVKNILCTIASWMSTVVILFLYLVVAGILTFLNRLTSVVIFSIKDPVRTVLPFVILVFIKRLLFLVPAISQYAVARFYPVTVDEALQANGSYYGDGKVPDRRELPMYLALDNKYKNFFPPIFVHSSKKKTGFLEYFKAVMGTMSVSDVLHNMLDQTLQLQLYSIYGHPKLHYDIGLSTSMTVAIQDYFEVPLSSYKIFYDTPNGRLSYSEKEHLIRYFNSYLPIQEHHIQPLNFSSKYTLVGNDHLTEGEYRRAGRQMSEIGQVFRRPIGREYPDTHSQHGLLADPHLQYERPGDDIDYRNYRYRRIMAGEYLVVVHGSVSDSFSYKGTMADEATVRKWLNYGLVLFGRSSAYGPFMAKETHYIVNRRMINNDHTTLTVSDNSGNIVRIKLEDPTFKVYCRSLLPRHLGVTTSASTGYGGKTEHDLLHGTFSNCNFNDLVIYYDYPFAFSDKHTFWGIDTFETLDSRSTPIAERRIKSERRLMTEYARITLIDPTFPRTATVNNSATMININPKIHVSIIFSNAKIPLDRAVECDGREFCTKLLTAEGYLQYFRPVSDKYLSYLSIKPLVAPGPATPNSMWVFTDTQLAYFYRELMYSKAQTLKQLESCQSGHKGASRDSGISSVLQPTPRPKYMCSRSYLSDLQHNLHIIELQLRDVVASQQGQTLLTCLSNRDVKELEAKTRDLRTMECTFLLQRLLVSALCGWILSCALQTYASIFHGLVHSVQQQISSVQTPEAQKHIAVACYTIQLVSIYSKIARFINNSGKDAKKGGYLHRALIRVLKWITTLYSQYVIYSNAPRLLAAIYLSNLQYRLIIAYLVTLILSGQLFAHFGLYNLVDSFLSRVFVKRLSTRLGELMFSKNTFIRGTSLLCLRLLNSVTILVPPTFLWAITSFVFKLMYHMSIEGVYGGEETFSHSLYRVTFSTFDFTIHTRLYASLLCVLVLTLFLLLSSQNFVFNWNLTYSLRHLPNYGASDLQIPAAYSTQKTLAKHEVLLSAGTTQLADEVRKIYPDFFTTQTSSVPKRKQQPSLRRHSSAHASTAQGSNSSGNGSSSSNDTFYFRPLEAITAIYYLEELAPWSPKLYLYGDVGYAKMFSVPGFYGFTIATNVRVSPHNSYFAYLEPSAAGIHEGAHDMDCDISPLHDQPPRAYINDVRKIPTIIYDQLPGFPAKKQLQGITKTRGWLFFRTTNRMTTTARIHCATLPWSIFLPTYELKIFRFMLPSHRLHALVRSTYPRSAVDPFISLALLLSSMTLPAFMNHCMVPIRYSFTVSPESIQKLQTGIAHAIVRRLAMLLSRGREYGSHITPPTNFQLGIADTPIIYEVGSSGDTDGSAVQVTHFSMSKDEINTAVQLSNSLLGGLKEVLTMDKGARMKGFVMPLGAVVRDDAMPMLTAQELYFLLTVCFFDHVAAGLLFAPKSNPSKAFLSHCPKAAQTAKEIVKHREHSATNDSVGGRAHTSQASVYNNYFRHELENLRADYSRLIQYIFKCSAVDYGSMPMSLSAYRLVSVLSQLQLFNKGLAFDQCAIFNSTLSSLLDWTTELLEDSTNYSDYSDDIHYTKFVCIVFDASRSNYKALGLTKKAAAHFLTKLETLSAAKDELDGKLNQIIHMKDSDLGDAELDCIEFIINRIVLRSLELSVLSIISAATSTLYNFVLRAAGYISVPSRSFVDELKRGELYTLCYEALPPPVRHLYVDDYNFCCNMCNMGIMKLFQMIESRRLVADYDVQSLLCASCYNNYYINIVYALASYNMDVRSALVNNTVKKLGKAWCCEDVLALIYHAGFVSDEFLIKQLMYEATAFIKNVPTKACEITTSGCIVASTHDHDHTYNIMRLHTVAEALLSVSLQIHRMRYLGAVTKHGNRRHVLHEVYASARYVVESSQQMALLHMLYSDRNKTKKASLYSSTHALLGPAIKQAMRTDWCYVLLHDTEAAEE